MALVEFPNKLGLIITPFNEYTHVPMVSSAAINAVGESVSFIGQLCLSSGPGTSKTISSAGGKIWFYPGNTVFASVGTIFRVGIQDVNSSTGIEDGTWDVYKDLAAGTDTIVINVIKEVTMSSGTKTITHGDIIAIVMEMTARAGTDSVSVNKLDVDSNFPYATGDTGAGPVKNATMPFCCIHFDDGTIGHFGEWTIPIADTLQSFLSTSTPDEYGIVFELPFKCTINAFFARLNGVNSGDNGTMHLITTPLTTPTDALTITLNPDLQGQTSNVIEGYSIFEITEIELQANTSYIISSRATGTSRIIRVLNLLHADMRKACVLGTSLQGATRTDLGAFTTSTTAIPDIGFRINKVDDGSGGGGSETSVAYIG